MLKTVALSASVLAFASGLAFAETTITREPSTGRTVVTNPSSSLSTGHWLASDVYKAEVYDPSEHKIGKVTNLMIDSNGNVTAAIIGVGGFLGAAQKDVVIPFKELSGTVRRPRPLRVKLQDLRINVLELSVAAWSRVVAPRLGRNEQSKTVATKRQGDRGDLKRAK